MSNIYGGMTIQGSPFVIDKIYDNYAAAVSAAADDGIYVGRYVMIQYCDEVLDYYSRTKVENATGISANWTANEKAYFTNYQFDKPKSPKSYDRIILKKIYKNNNLQYTVVCCLHPMAGSNYTDDTMEAVGIINSLNMCNGEGDYSIKTSGDGNAFAYGSYSLAYGANVQTNGMASVAFGQDTIAKTNYGMAIGQYNQITVPSLFSVGNGNSDNRKDAFTIDTNNNIIANTLTPQYIKGWNVVENTNNSNQYIINLETDSTKVDMSVFSLNSDIFFIVSNNFACKGKIVSIDSTNYILHIQKSYGGDISTSAIINFIYLSDKTTGPDIWFPTQTFLLGNNNYLANNDYSLSVGIDNAVMGAGSVSIGKNNYSMGVNSFTQGVCNQAWGQYSSAKGNNTQATGFCACAEGYATKASGVYSHAQGNNTEASGAYSSASGCQTKVTQPYSTVVGKYNNTDQQGLFSVGIGTNLNNRLTGFYVNTDGMAYLPVATISGIDADTTGKSIVTKEYADTLWSQQSDYIIAHGHFTARLMYDPTTGAQTEDESVAGSAQRTFPVYYEKWASGKSICKFATGFMPSVYSAGGVGGGTTEYPNSDYYIGCFIDLNYDKQAQTLQLFSGGRYIAFVEPKGNPGVWMFVRGTDNSSVMALNDATENNPNPGECLVKSEQNYKIFPTFWIKPWYTGTWNGEVTSHKCFYCEVTGWWKHPLFPEE